MSDIDARTPLRPTFEIPGGLNLEIVPTPLIDGYIYRITCTGTTDVHVASEAALLDQIMVDYAARIGVAEFTHQLRALLERLADPEYNEALQ